MIKIESLPRNDRVDSGDMAAIEGGISFPRNIAPIKLIPPPQPVTGFDVGGGGLSGGTLSHGAGEQD